MNGSSDSAGAIALATAVWAIGYTGWLPAAKLTPPVWRQGARRVAVSARGHTAFGIISAIPILLLDRKGLTEPWWLSALQRITRCERHARDGASWEAGAGH